MRSRSRRLSVLLTLAIALALSVADLGAPAATGAGSRRAAGPRAHASASFMAGVGDEQSEMFSDSLWKRLHTRIARYIAPYDAAVRPVSLARARAWIRGAEAQHVKMLVSFYHSEYTATTLPSVALYKHDVQKFIRLFPNVRQYQSWDEANRGNVPFAFSSPSAAAAARYYQALIRVCNGCTAIGLDVLDQANIAPTLRYIAEFKHEIGRLRTIVPKIWGLHDYSDVNRRESWRTREISRALGGQVWLTETGGIVKFGGAFPNIGGSGLARAAAVIKYTFALAYSQSSRIKRLYLYNWTGGGASERFDAGLTDAHHRPRVGYVAACRAMHASNCGVRISSR